MTEIVVQALARILTLDANSRLRARWTGRGVARDVLTVHDELVWVAKEEVAQELLRDMVHEMTITPDWAKGLPLAAKGGIAQRYGDIGNDRDCRASCQGLVVLGAEQF
jgi:hypothetical protein